DFKGNLLAATRRLAAAFDVEPTWNAAANDITDLRDPEQIRQRAGNLLERPSAGLITSFTVETTYDALNRETSRTTPDGSVTAPKYTRAGLLEQVLVGVGGPATRVLVANIDYNARGQRLAYEYADPTAAPPAAGQPSITCRTEYRYDPFTF